MNALNEFEDLLEERKTIHVRKYLHVSVLNEKRLLLLLINILLGDLFLSLIILFKGS